MATRASGSLIIIIEKKHAPWGHTVSASPSLEHIGPLALVPAPNSLRMGPLRPLVPICQSSGPCEFRAGQWLTNGLDSLQWATEACLAAARHTSHGFGWVQVGLIRCPDDARGVHRAL